MRTKFTVLLASLVISIFLVSGCIGGEDTSEQGTGAAVLEEQEPEQIEQSEEHKDCDTVTYYAKDKDEKFEEGCFGNVLIRSDANYHGCELVDTVDLAEDDPLRDEGYLLEITCSCCYTLRYEQASGF